jgi:hypothetical protein
MVTAACLAHLDAFDDPSSPGYSKGALLNPRIFPPVHPTNAAARQASSTPH